MGSHPLEFATTACCRPKIVNATYRSFTRLLKGVQWHESTLYLNIDPMPEKRDPMEVVEVAQRYFGNVVYNISEESQFTKAIKWCFQQPKDDMFFYLQDDWQLVKRVRIQELKAVLGNRVNLSKYNKEKARVVNVILRAYSSISDHRICLSPCLMDTEWAKEYSLKLDEGLNPERQFRPKGKNNKGGGQASSKYFVGQQYPANNMYGVQVKDLGRPWLKKHNLRRNALNWKFNSWIKRGQKYKSTKNQKPPEKNED